MSPAPAKMGGNRSLSILVEGSEYLADSLLAVGEGGRKIAKGLARQVRESYDGRFEVEIHGEPWVPAELLLAARSPSRIGVASTAWSARDPSGGVLPPPTRLFAQPCDVVVFSLEPEITRPLWRHRADGFAVSPPPDWERDWSAERKDAFAANFEPEGLTPVERFRQTFGQLVAEIKAQTAAQIIVFNCFTFDPDDRIRSYFGREDTLALRALKFNLALIDISTAEGISIVDVDRLLAEAGGASHVEHVFRYSARGCELLRDEFFRVLREIGFFESRPLVMQVGRKRA